MSMIVQRIKLTATMLLLIMCTLTDGLASDISKPSFRSLTTEATIGIRYLEKETVDFDGGAKAEVNSDVGWGFGLGYNINENIGLSAEFSWLSTGYRGTRVVDDAGNTENFNGIMDASTIAFRGTYYFMKTRMTPYASASFGWTHIDTNIPVGPPITVCWWDPWWGYICGPYVPTATQTAFGYGAGLGLRWDISTKFFMKASYNWTKQDISNTSSDPSLNNIIVDFGFL